MCEFIFEYHVIHKNNVMVRGTVRYEKHKIYRFICRNRRFP